MKQLSPAFPPFQTTWPARGSPPAGRAWRGLLGGLALALVNAALPALPAALRVPAATAYLEPSAEGARVSGRSGVTGWKDPKQRVLWFGEFAVGGTVDAEVALRLPETVRSRLRLTVAGQAREATVAGAGTNVVIAPFGRFELRTPGYQRFELESLNPAGQPAGDLDALVLTGTPVTNAHFNLKPRRNAASVHLSYVVPAVTNIAAFYAEVTAVEEPLHTFYMACGWHRGYFGMQINSPTERRIIFSVWDSGDEAVDRKKVGEENRVTLMGRGEGVHAGDFGNEGTGGHSHLKHPWRTGERQRFLVTAQPTNGTFTVYTGYYFHPEKRAWMLISSWRAPKDGGWLRRPHSFSENFSGGNGQLVRKARYGNPWVRSADGAWHEILTASFSHDPTGREDRRDRFMGVEQGEFFLSHGGFVPGHTRFGERFTRLAAGGPPRDLQLPPVTLGTP